MPLGPAIDIETRALRSIAGKQAIACTDLLCRRKCGLRDLCGCCMGCTYFQATTTKSHVDQCAGAGQVAERVQHDFEPCHL